MWLREEGKSATFVLWPLVFLLTITLWSLGVLALVNLRESQGFDVKLANGVSAVLLLAARGLPDRDRACGGCESRCPCSCAREGSRRGPQ